MAASTPSDIYRVLEEVFATYEQRATDALINPRAENVTDAHLHLDRGRCQAARDLRRIVRSHLAYDPDAL